MSAINVIAAKFSNRLLVYVGLLWILVLLRMHIRGIKFWPWKTNWSFKTNDCTVHISSWRLWDSANVARQGPITRSEQRPWARVTAFSLTSSFLERFWREFWISFKYNKPVSKTYRPKNDILCVLITFSFPFWCFVLRMCSYTWWRFFFCGKSCPKMCLKINCVVCKNAVT